MCARIRVEALSGNLLSGKNVLPLMEVCSSKLTHDAWSSHIL